MHSYKKQLKSLFSQLCFSLNYPEPEKIKFSNGKYEREWLKLDYNPIYGGYRLDIVHQNTSESFFWTSSRLSTKEIIAFIQGFLVKTDNLYH